MRCRLIDSGPNNCEVYGGGKTILKLTEVLPSKQVSEPPVISTFDPFNRTFKSSFVGELDN